VVASLSNRPLDHVAAAGFRGGVKPTDDETSTVP
jgi:hypothetical protein